MKTRRALPSSRRLLLLVLELILISSVTFSLTTTLGIRLRPHFLATSLTTANMTTEETTTLESRLYDLLTNHRKWSQNCEDHAMDEEAFIALTRTRCL
jgi:hypothetical protein